MKTTLFGKPMCQGCEMAKQYLASKKIDYDYIDVTTDVGFETLQALDDTIQSVPVLSVEKDGKVYNYVSFNRERYDEVFE